MTNQIENILSRHEYLKSERGQWESHWQELAEVLLPWRADFTARQTPGGKRANTIYDGAPMRARRGLATAVDGLLKPKTSKWFHLRVRDDDDDPNENAEVKRWIEAVEERMYSAIYARSAHFVRRSGEVDNDLVTFGTGGLFIGEGKNLNRLLFRSLHLRNMCVKENSDGEIDTMFLDMLLTARQAAQEFGEENLGTKTREALSGIDKKPDEKFSFLQVVQPREERDPRRRDNLNLPFASVVIDVASEHKIGEGGFHGFPFAVPRWDTASGEVWGRSPGMIALPDANTLQQMGKTLLKAGHMGVDPPLFAASDSIIGVPRTYPGGITYFDAEVAGKVGRIPVESMRTGANIPLGREMQNDTREAVEAAFFRNIFNLPVDAPKMTATEVLERKEEFLRTVGPTLGQLESDYPAVIVERVFNIMHRAGAFPEAPEILRDRDIDFAFASPVEQARKQIEAAGAARSMELLAPFVAADPELMDNFDGDEIARDTPEIFGMPQKWIRPKEQVEQCRQARAQQAQAAAMLEGAEKIADVAGKAKELGIGAE